MSDQCDQGNEGVIAFVKRSRSFLSSNQVIVEGSVGSLGWANCDSWVVKFTDGLGGDEGGNGGGLPISIGTVDQNKSSGKPKDHHWKPNNFDTFDRGT